MVYEDKEWKYSTASAEPPSYSFTPGERNLQITRAELRDEGGDKERVVVFFKDLETNEQFPVTYSMIYKGDNGYTSVRKSSIIALHNIKKALRGPDCGDGLMHPDLMVGGVIKATVSIGPGSTDERRFAQLMDVQAVPFDLAMINPKEQYYIEDE